MLRSHLRRLPGLTTCGVVVCALTLSGCGSGGPKDDRPIIAAAFAPLAWAAEEIAGDAYRTENLTKADTGSHDDSLGIRQVADIERADLVLVLAGLQPAVARAAENVAKGAVLDAADVVDLVPFADHRPEPDEPDEHDGHDHDGHDHDGHDHGEESEHDEHDHGEDDEESGHDGHDHDGHDHGEEDPHFWQDPLRMAMFTDAVARTLAERHPESAAQYTQRAHEVRARLTQLDADYRTGLADCTRTTVVVSHDAFGYLSKYGLSFEAINGLSPDAEPTPHDLARLQKLIADEGITTVFSEARATQKLAQTLARDTGVETAVLDPLEVLETGPRGDYLTVMRANLAALRKANECR